MLYYVIYAPRRRRQQKLTIYRLEQGKYQLMTNNPVWMPEIGLGIGSQQGIHEGIKREWLYWFDRAGNRYPTEAEARSQAEQQAQQAEQREEQQRQRAEQLAARLRALGIDLEEG